MYKSINLYFSVLNESVLDGRILNSPLFCFLLKKSSPSGIAKHDQCCMQFTDSAGKFACGAQFCTCKELQPLLYSYLKVLKVSSLSVVQ